MVRLLRRIGWRSFFFYIGSVLSTEASSSYVSTQVVIDERAVEIRASTEDDLLQLGERFCQEHKIDHGEKLRDGRPRCATLIADELADEMYCNNTNSAEKKGFRFYHGTYYFDSEEYELLRSLFLRQDLVECLSGERLHGGEAIVWVLGHFEEDSQFYHVLHEDTIANAIPNPTELGAKDKLYAHLKALDLGDDAMHFVPRTWLPAELKAIKPEMNQSLGGLWLLKEPEVELGGGIRLVSTWSEVYQCPHCLLQRYVSRPMLLNDQSAGINKAKFSVGVYLTVSSLDPLEVWLHREMLVLLCTQPYQDPYDSSHEAESPHLLAHLTNGLLNQRLDADYNPSERVWTTDRLLAHIKKMGLSWTYIEDQIRDIAGLVLLAARRPLLKSSQKVGQKSKVFSHWRLDFLFDIDAKVWLLEAEIVPSTGTIGGVDEVLKTAVLRDVLALNGLGGPPTASQKNIFPWLRGQGCWRDSESRAEPPNQVCPPPDPSPSLFGPAAEEAATQGARLLLEKAKHPLALDSNALHLIGKYEARRARKGGYRQLYPLPRTFQYFDGTQGTMKKSQSVLKYWRDRGALGTDLVLDAWSEFIGRKDSASISKEGRADDEWHQDNTLSESAGRCRACLRQASHSFCATVNNELRIIGRCQLTAASCAHAGPGLTDGVRLDTETDCAFDQSQSMTQLIDKSNAAALDHFAPAIVQYCRHLFSHKNEQAKSHAISRLCGTQAPAKHAKRRPDVKVLEIDGCDPKLKDMLADAMRSNRPLLIRRALCTEFTPWSEMIANYSSSPTPVVAMAFDSGTDSAAPIFSAPMSLGDFLSGTFASESELPYGGNTSLYLLLTDRQRVDKGSAGTLADPNAEATAQSGPVSDMLNSAAQALDAFTALKTLSTAWSSLRLGDTYRYPSHVDCYENLLLQLHGVKNLTLFSPDAVSHLQPDLRHKHWPRADQDDLREAQRLAVSLTLRPGDAAYIPVLWPHNVATAEWSISANRYFRVTDHTAWRQYIEDRKSLAWLLYEHASGEGMVC